MTSGDREDLDWRLLTVEPSGESGGHCDCCGTATRRIWGWVHYSEGTLAAYFVGWTEGKPDHGVAVDLALGFWGDTTTPEDRYAVALDYRHGANTFTIVDATDRVADNPQLVSSALVRDAIVDTPLGQQVFAIAEAIFVASNIGNLTKAG